MRIRNRNKRTAMTFSLVLTLIVTSYFSSAAAVSHTPAQVTPGTFASGNYVFPNNMSVTGNVGIGTTNPSYNLDVSGTGRFTGALTSATINTGNGDMEVNSIAAYQGNQNLRTTDAPTFATLNTGQGANELYDMNQNVLTTSSVTFNSVSSSGGYLYMGADTSIYRYTTNMIRTDDTLYTTANLAVDGRIETSDIVDEGYLDLTTGGGGLIYGDLVLKPVSYSGNQDGGIRFRDTGDNWAFDFALKSTSGGVPYFAFDAHAMTNSLTIFNTGRVGIGMGTTSPSYSLQLGTNSAAKPSTNTWTITSDRRVKENIRPFTDGLEVITKIKPITYTYNGKAGFNASSGDHIGVIAQEIMEVAPYTVNTYYAKLDAKDENETELYNFDSGDLTFVMINAIKELEQESIRLKEILCEEFPEKEICNT